MMNGYESLINSRKKDAYYIFIENDNRIFGVYIDYEVCMRFNANVLKEIR